MARFVLIAECGNDDANPENTCAREHNEKRNQEYVVEYMFMVGLSVAKIR